MANEKRLISVDAHKLEELLSECFDVIKSIKPTQLSLMGALLVWIGCCKQATVDAVEVVHGRWIKDGDVVVCSNCGEEHAWDEYRATYCEDCGAKMDGGDEDG